MARGAILCRPAYRLIAIVLFLFFHLIFFSFALLLFLPHFDGGAFCAEEAKEKAKRKHKPANAIGMI